jgi:myo-inositol 2-dehydrogenase/D-chiro-inositol 1-dehydrogenase
MPHPLVSRRVFLGTSTAAAFGTALGSRAEAALDQKKLKIALIGCGGRGTGAASQALKADANVELVALADIAPDQMDKSLAVLQKAVGPEKINVQEDHKFSGLDGIDKVLATDVDVVLLTTPPGFRPEHYEKAVKAGKHAFCEKPIAADAPGVRRFLAAVAESKKQGLGCQSGFCWRAKYAERETQQKIRDGVIGDVRAVYGTYLGGTPWVKPRQAGWTDLEYQLRNWMYFTWLSGDHLVEQAVHTVDKMCWTFNDMDPVSATGTGGRQQRVEEQYGHIYDHFAIQYEYPGGARGFIFCRQQQGCAAEVSDHYLGTKGTIDQVSGRTNRLRTFEGDSWKFDGENNDMYQTEHDEFFASLRQGKPLNNGEKLAHSTMVAIMGRMAAYTGQTVTWEDAINSKEVLAPAQLDWKMTLATPPVAIPGRTKFL